MDADDRFDDADELQEKSLEQQAFFGMFSTLGRGALPCLLDLDQYTLATSYRHD